MNIKVVNNHKQSRFEAEIDGKIAFITYRINDDAIVLIHSSVPASLEGQGIGSTLARTALDYARDHNYQVVPECPFIRSYVERHPEKYGDLVA